MSWRESLAIFLTPILFNLILSLGAASLMRELGAAVSFHTLSDTICVSLGRILILIVFIELFVGVFGLIIMGRPAHAPRLHGLLLGSAVLAALTPGIADLPQATVGLGPGLPLLAAVGAAILAQAGLWTITYLLTGIAMDALRGAPPTFVKAVFHAKSGFMKGAIYGGTFMFLLLAAAAILRAPGFAHLVSQQPILAAAIAVPYCIR